MYMLSCLQKKYRIKGVMFSNSPAVKNYCDVVGITVISHYRTNDYGLPFIRDMLLEIKRLYDADSYGYMNSDIMLSEILVHSLPFILEILHKHHMEVSPFPPPHAKGEMFSRVYSINQTVFNIDPDHLTHHTLSFPKKLILRRRASAVWTGLHVHTQDIFIFTRGFDLNVIPPVVIGRRAVDPVLTGVAKKNGYWLIDLSRCGRNMHLGVDGWKTNTEGKDERDVEWNLPIYENYTQYGDITGTADYVVTRLGMYSRLFIARNQRGLTRLISSGFYPLPPPTRPPPSSVFGQSVRKRIPPSS